MRTHRLVHLCLILLVSAFDGRRSNQSENLTGTPICLDCHQAVLQKILSPPMIKVQSFNHLNTDNWGQLLWVITTGFIERT